MRRDRPRDRRSDWRRPRPSPWASTPTCDSQLGHGAAPRSTRGDAAVRQRVRREIGADAVTSWSGAVRRQGRARDGAARRAPARGESRVARTAASWRSAATTRRCSLAWRPSPARERTPGPVGFTRPLNDYLAAPTCWSRSRGRGCSRRRSTARPRGRHAQPGHDPSGARPMRSGWSARAWDSSCGAGATCGRGQRFESDTELLGAARQRIEALPRIVRCTRRSRRSSRAGVQPESRVNNRVPLSKGATTVRRAL